MSDRAIAAFDFDGTLTRRDTFAGFLREVAGMRALLGASLADLPRLALAAAGRGSRDDAKQRMLSRLFTGLPADEVATLGRAYGTRLAEAALRPGALAWLRRHRDLGHEIVIVSASLDSYLTEVGHRLGVDAVLSTTLEVGDDGLLTGRMLGPNCRGAEKVARLTAHLGGERDGVVVWAYGDSAGDRELLAFADHPFRVERRSGRLLDER